MVCPVDFSDRTFADRAVLCLNLFLLFLVLYDDSPESADIILVHLFALDIFLIMTKHERIKELEIKHSFLLIDTEMSLHKKHKDWIIDMWKRALYSVGRVVF